MRLLVAALILSAVIVLGFAAYEARVLIPEPSNGTAQGVVWRGRTFATRVEFARWLRSHGVSYRAWARSHPVEAGLAKDRGQKHSGRGAGHLAGIAALLAALALGVAFVRRRWPESGASAAHWLEVIGLKCVAAAKATARATRRGAALTARRSAALATAAASRARHWTTGPAAHRLEVMGLRGAAAAKAGAQTTRRRAALTGRRSAALANAAASRARHWTAGPAAHRFELVALRGAAAAKMGARTTRRSAALTARRSEARATAGTSGARHGMARSAANRLEVMALRGGTVAKTHARRTRRWAALTARRSAALATLSTFSARRRRYDLVWYLAIAVLAAGTGLAVTAWLGG